MSSLFLSSEDEYHYSYSDFYDDYDDFVTDEDEESTYTYSDNHLLLQDKDPMFAENLKLKQYLSQELFCDVIVKVEDKSYKLHKVLLCLKSLYFQRLFSGHFVECNQKEVTLQLFDASIFDLIVKYLYENELSSSITSENMTRLMVAIDYLHIDVNFNAFIKFIEEKKDIPMAHVFELYNYLLNHTSHPWLLNAILKYFSKNLLKVSQCEYFCTISFDEFKKILLFNRNLESLADERRNIVSICAKWIHHDMDNRTPHIVELINVVKYRYSNAFFLVDINVEIDCSGKANAEKYIVQQLDKLLNYSTEFIPGATLDYLNLCCEDSLNSPKSSINVIDEMKQLLETGIVSDVCIKVKNRTFNLHKLVLACKSQFFHDLFTKSSAENTKEFEISQVEESAFYVMMKYVYYQELDLTAEENIVNLLHASEFLQMKGIFFRFEQFILANLQRNICIFELFSYLRSTPHTKLFLRVQDHIVSNWPKILEQNNILNVSIDVLKEIVSLRNLFPKNESEILNCCAKWINYDLKNRFHYISTLLQAVSRCISIQYKINFTFKDVIKAKNSEDFLEEQIYKILSTSNLINEINLNERSRTPVQSLVKPFFVGAEQNELRFFKIENDKSFTEIESIRLTLPNFESVGSACAAIIRNTLFVQFNETYLYAHNLYTRRSVSLTTDGLKNNLRNTQLISCNDELYLGYISEGKIFKYSVKLNRWLSLPDGNCRSAIYACGGKVLYAISTTCQNNSFIVEYYDEYQNIWKSLTYISDMNRNYDYPIAACFFNTNLFVACNSYAKMFNIRHRKWSTVYNSANENNRMVINAKQMDKSILFLDENSIQSFNITTKKWNMEFSCDKGKFQCMNLIHYY